MSYKGLYIVFEGGEGGGKSTQVRLLAEKLKEEHSNREIVVSKEPGGTLVADIIRNIVLNTKIEDGQLENITEAYLFAASRAQSLREVVVPARASGAVVIVDRSVMSSLAYQGYGRQMGVELVWQINKLAVDGILPDKVFLIDLDPEIGLERVRLKRGDKNDRIDRETNGLHQRVRAGFLEIAKLNPDMFIIIDGTLTIEGQAELIWKETEKLMADEGRCETTHEFRL